MPLIADNASDAAINQNKAATRPPVAREPKNLPKSPRKIPPTTITATIRNGLNGSIWLNRSGLCPRLRRGQLLAVDYSDDPVDACGNAAGKIPAPESRRDDFIDDALGGDVVKRAFKAVADLDAKFAVVLGNNQQCAVVDLLAPDLPGLGDPDRILLDGFRRRRRHDQHRDLAAFPRFEGFQGLRQRRNVAARESSGLVDDPARQRRHRDVGCGRESPAY